MASTHTEQTLHVSEYVRLFCKLHALVAGGEGSTDAANELREELDYHWRNLTSEEVSLVDGLAIDLSRIGADWESPKKIHITLLAEFEELKNSRNWIETLGFLRKHELLLPRAQVFALRGFCWAEIGQYTAATYFLGEAIRIAPDDLRFQGLFLSNMVRAEKLDDARRQALVVAARGSDPVELFLAADILFKCAVATNDSPAASELRQICEVAARGRAALEEPPSELWRRQLAFSGQLSQAMAYELLGDRPRAFDAVRAAMALAPKGVGNISGSENWPDETTDGEQFRRVLEERLEQSHELSSSFA
jgi:tetratricopeptide (TPR) repeat protein